MLPQPTQINETVRAYLLKEVLPGEDPRALEDATPLITGGILDSISSVKLVAFLEDRYGIEFHAHEVSVDHLDTVNSIVDIVSSKIHDKGQSL